MVKKVYHLLYFTLPIFHFIISYSYIHTRIYIYTFCTNLLSNFNSLCKGIISCLAFNPDFSGLYAAGSYSQSIGLYDESNNEMLYLLRGTPSEPIGSVTQVSDTLVLFYLLVYFIILRSLCNHIIPMIHIILNRSYFLPTEITYSLRQEGIIGLDVGIFEILGKFCIVFIDKEIPIRECHLTLIILVDI